MAQIWVPTSMIVGCARASPTTSAGPSGTASADHDVVARRNEAKGTEDRAGAALGDPAPEVLHGPRPTLGPPWAEDHRTALGATVLVG
jgi:hypothetical protein